MSGDPQPRPPATGNIAGVQVTPARLWRLTRKELRETLRDRRTILTLFLMPLLVYPLLSLAFRQFLFTSYQTPDDSSTKWNIGVASIQDHRTVEELLAFGERVQNERPAENPRSAGEESRLLPQVFWYEGADFAERLSSRDLDVGVRLQWSEPQPESNRRELVKCEIIYRDDSALSVDLARRLERILQAVNDSQWRLRLQKLGGSTDPAVDFEMHPIRDKKPYSLPLATLVPLILILMTITGAVYPAIDLTAGERERGTLESLVATPIPRFAVLVAKYIAVLTVAILTALMNIVAMTVTVHSTGLGSILFGVGGLSLFAVVQVFCLMVMFAAFFSAVLLALTSFARSFKEAQAYLIPLMLFAMTPGFLSAVPGVSLTGWWAVTPLANMVLLARDVLEQGADPWWAIVAIASTIVYGLSALVLAANIFGNDAILYGSQDSWEEWFSWPKKVMPQPAMGLAMFTLAMIFPLHVWLTGQLSQATNPVAMPGMPIQITAEMIQNSLLGGCVITWGLYLLLPIAIAAIRRLDLPRTFQVLPFPPLALIGVVVLGFSLWPVAHEIVVFSQRIGLATLSGEKLAKVSELAIVIRQLPFIGVFFCLAITPAICEELFFRGYFFSALKAEAKGWTTILLSGVIFGLFHVILGSGAQVERLFSTSLLGCVLAWVAWRTGSVVPSMILHLIHNGLLVRLMFVTEDLTPNPISGLHLPISWQVGGIVGTTVGLILVWLATRRNITKAENADSKMPAT